MKKLMSIFGAALFVFALTSCDPEAADEGNEGNDTENTENTEGGDGGE